LLDAAFGEKHQGKVVVSSHLEAFDPQVVAVVPVALAEFATEASALVVVADEDVTEFAVAEGAVGGGGDEGFGANFEMLDPSETEGSELAAIGTAVEEVVDGDGAAVADGEDAGVNGSAGLAEG